MNNQRIFVILLIGALVLGALSFYINSNPDVLKKPTPTLVISGEKLFDFDPTTTIALSVSDRVKGLNFTAQLDEKNVWQIKEPKQIEGDATQLRTAASSISTLWPLRTFQEGISLTEFGVAKPDYLIEVRIKGGQAFKLEVGKKDVTGAGYYVRKEGSATPVLISVNALDLVLALPSNPPPAPPTVAPTLLGPLPLSSTPTPAVTATP